jgi:hypothetical protein
MTPGQDLVTRLKEQISTRRYRVDSQAVAREMVFKMRMLAMLRESPTTPASFGAKAPHRHNH